MILPRSIRRLSSQAKGPHSHSFMPMSRSCMTKIGMNEWLCEPLAWDDSRRMDRGKIMTAEMLDAGKEFGRYLDVDGDGIPYRTLPGTHPTRGAFLTRGTTKNRYAKYSEEGPVYLDNMERL